MKAIRTTTTEWLRRSASALLLLVLLLSSEGTVISVHYCCSRVETVQLFAATSECCTDATACSSEAPGCTALDEHQVCCQTASAYLLLPIVTRGDEARGTTIPPATAAIIASLLPVALLQHCSRSRQLRLVLVPSPPMGIEQLEVLRL